MKKIILNSLLALLVFGGSITTYAISEDEVSSSTSNVFCTQEVKQCPDGSFVGRTGPRCEFARCPDAPTRFQKIKMLLEPKRENNKNELREKMEARLASSSANRIEKREEARERVENKIASTSTYRLERRFEKITRNYLREIVRLEQILGRVVSRIEKIKSLGGKTADAEKYVEEAKMHLSEARKTYDVLKTIATDADDNATTTKEMLGSIKNSAKEVENHLRLTHKSLQKTVGSLRGVSQLNNASSTVPTLN